MLMGDCRGAEVVLPLRVRVKLEEWGWFGLGSDHHAWLASQRQNQASHLFVILENGDYDGAARGYNKENKCDSLHMLLIYIQHKTVQSFVQICVNKSTSYYIKTGPLRSSWGTQQRHAGGGSRAWGRVPVQVCPMNPWLVWDWWNWTEVAEGAIYFSVKVIILHDFSAGAQKNLVKPVLPQPF